MKAEPDFPAVSRREALRHTFLASLGLAVLPTNAPAQPMPSPPAPAYVPENDYPFFGDDAVPSDLR